MKRKIFIVGIGSGNPEHVTVEAIAALNQARVFFVPDKGAEKRDLAELRRTIIARYVDNPDYRVVGFDNPVRNSADPSYHKGVADWHAAVEDVYERLLADELGDGDCGAFLAWGDPSLYDSVLRIMEKIGAKHPDVDYEAIPGISSIQALAAAHRIPLNRIGETVLITTGRKLADGFPDGADSVVVMLDGRAAYKDMNPDIEIFWGAYLGTEDEILVSGRLGDVRDRIERVREEARAKKGWIMDTYLLRKPERT